LVRASSTCISMAWRSVRVALTLGNSCKQGSRSQGGNSQQESSAASRQEGGERR
jgi:hypothetical protein